MVLKVGDKFPVNVTSVTENSPDNTVDLAKELGTGKVVLLGVPGAFTPTCNNIHVPSYLADFDKFKAKGVDKIIVIAVNDAFVMKAWGDSMKATGKLRFFADAQGELAKATGLDVNAAKLGGVRMKRFSALLHDGTVEQLNVEPDNFGATCSLAPQLKL